MFHFGAAGADITTRCRLLATYVYIPGGDGSSARFPSGIYSCTGESPLSGNVRRKQYAIWHTPPDAHISPRIDSSTSPYPVYVFGGIVCPTPSQRAQRGVSGLDHAQPAAQRRTGTLGVDIFHES